MAQSAKVSITLDRELLEEARRYAGGNLSGWVGEALRDRVAVERGRAFLREREAERGALDPALLDEVRRTWRPSSSTPDR